MSDMRLKESTELYLDSQQGMISKNTASIYRHAFTHLLRFFEPDMSVRKMDKLKAEKFRIDLLNYRRYSKSKVSYRVDGRKLAVSTIRQIIKISRILFSWLLEIGEVDQNPFEKLKLPAIPSEEPEIVENDDFDKFVYECAQGVEARANDKSLIVRDIAILYFLRSTGCRVSGAATTQLCDLKVYEDSGESIVREKFKGGPKSRAVFLNEEAVLAVMMWLDVRPETSNHDFLFVNVSGRYKGDPISTSAIRNMIYKLYERYQERCKSDPNLIPMSKKISPHRLRATAISGWIESGLNDTTVSKLAGNSELVMRKHYARVNRNQLKEAHKLASQFRNSK